VNCAEKGVICAAWLGCWACREKCELCRKGVNCAVWLGCWVCRKECELCRKRCDLCSVVRMLGVQSSRVGVMVRGLGLDFFT